MMDTVPDNLKGDLNEYLAKYKPGSSEAQHLVGLFRLEKMFDSKKKRLIIAMRDPKWEHSLVSCVEAIEKKQAWSGPRPPGQLELEGQQVLEAISAGTGSG